MMSLVSSVSSPLSLSSDSLLAGLALGPWLTPRRALGLAAAFGVCDAAGTWLGTMGAPFGWALAMAALLTAEIALALRSRSWIVVIPVVMAADNYLASDPVPSVAVAGGCSFVMALAGLSLARGLVRGMRPVRLGVAR